MLKKILVFFIVISIQNTIANSNIESFNHIPSIKYNNDSELPFSCGVPTVLFSDNVTNVSVDFEWGIVSGVDGYEYVLDNFSSDPLVSGNFTTNIYYNALNLNSNSTYYFHLRTVCSSGKSAWISTFVTTLSSPECSVLVFPPDQSSNVIIDGDTKGVKFSWLPVTSQSPISYNLYYSQSPTFPNPPVVGIVDSFRNVIGLQNNKTYYWKVVTVFDGYESTDCQVYQFTTAGVDECINAIELTPGVDFNDGAIIASNTTATPSFPAFMLSCYSSENSTEADVWYSVIVPPSGNLTIETDLNSAIINNEFTDTVLSVFSGNCGNLTEIGCNDDNPNGLTLFSKVLLSGLLAGDKIYIRAMGFTDGQGSFLLSAYDTAFVACEIPSNVQSSEITSSAAKLSWDIIPGSLNYEYIINNSAATPNYNGIIINNSNVDLTSLQPDRTYYFHVRNNCGIYKSKWVTYSFVTLLPSVDCVSSTVPANSSTNVNVTNNSIALSWSPSSTGNLPTRYDLFFGIDANALVKIASDISLLSYIVNGITENTQYFWKVVPKYVSLVAANCTVNNFTTSTPLPPNCVTSFLPSNSSVDVPIPSGSLILSWDAPTGGSTTGYDVYFGTSTTALNLETTNISSASYQVNGLSYETQYFWKVVPKNGTLDALNCVVNNFTTSANLDTDYFSDSKFSYYPNPVENVINFINNDEITTIEVRDLMSKEIISRKINESSYQLNMTGLEQGTYFIKITANNHSKTIKVLKK